MVSYYAFGGDPVILTKEELDKLRSVDYPLGITTLGFAPKNLVLKPGHNLRPCYLMRPDDKRALHSSTTFRAFLDSLKEKDEVALCTIRKRTNEIPRLHALVPQTEVRTDREEDKMNGLRRIIACEGFHVVPLPYADDIRKLPGGFALSEEPDQSAVDIAKKLLKNVRIGQSVFKKLEDNRLANPALLTQFAQIEALALSTEVKRADPVTDLDGAIQDIAPPKFFTQGTRAETIKELSESLKAAISGEYDIELESKAGGKRKREENPEATEKAAAKKENSLRMVSETNWGEMLENDTLKKATVPMLKAYCEANGLSKPAKKPELLDVVAKHLGSTTCI